MFFANKQNKVESLITDYNQQVAACMTAFREALQQYCENPDREAIKSRFGEVHKAESKADDIRRDIEVLMYAKSLFPESRGDILGLLEALDKVPNQAENVVLMIWNQRVAIPPELNADILHLVDVCCRCVEALMEAADKLFTNFTNATVAVGKVDELESEADRADSALIVKLFESELDALDKILVRDMIKKISAISDRAENAGDRIRITVAKRSV